MIVRALAAALTFVALALSACSDYDEDGGDDTPVAASSTATAGPSTPEAATPEGTQAPTEIPLTDGPPPLEVDGVFLGLGNHCWALPGTDQVCDEQDGVVTSPAVLDGVAAESINVTGFGQFDPTEASARLWPRPEVSESQGASRQIWQRTGDPIVVPVAPGTDAIAITLDAAPGAYLLDLLVTYEEGAAEYGLQVDVR